MKTPSHLELTWGSNGDEFGFGVWFLLEDIDIAAYSLNLVFAFWWLTLRFAIIRKKSEV